MELLNKVWLLLITAFGLWIETVYLLESPQNCTRYTPTWDSLDSRSLPSWYDEAKFGIFIHWGVFSVPGFGSEWFWEFWKGKNKSEYLDFMNKNYPPGFTYQDFAHEFRAEFYNPDDWAELFNNSGAKYVVLTTKHHEGFTLWPSKYSFSWNSMDLGPKRDLVGDLADAIRSKTNVKFGVYHSMFEWFNPLYQHDKQNLFKTQDFVKSKTIPELYELVMRYKPEVIWSDGAEEAPDIYWESQQFLTWLYNESPVKETVVVNDRWGTDTACHHGGFYTCSDRYNPGVLQPHKWENCMTIDQKSWGFRRNARLSDFLSIEELVKTLVETVSCGGNLLMNVGPTKEGIITPIFEERLRAMGRWLQVNGEGIYATKPWIYQNDTVTSGVWYTQNGNSVEVLLYAIVLQWPGKNLELGALLLENEATVSLLGYPNHLKWAKSGNNILIKFPNKEAVESEWAWVLKITGIIN